MKNPERNDLLLRALRGKLTEQEKREFDSLLAGDPAFRKEWEDERALDGLLSGVPDVPISSNFTSQVLQAVEREQRSSKRPVRPFLPWLHTAFARVAVGLCAVAVIGLAGVHQYQKAQREGMVRSVQSFTQVASAMTDGKTPPEEIFRNFDTIRSLPAPASDLDLELLVALQK